MREEIISQSLTHRKSKGNSVIEPTQLINRLIVCLVYELTLSKNITIHIYQKYFTFITSATNLVIIAYALHVSCGQ
jgi:hypothetical protein